MAEIEDDIAALGNVGNEDFTLALAQQVLKLSHHVREQHEMIRGVMVVADAAMTLARINNDRVLALEERARGLSMQDIVDGREPTPLGPTQVHYEALQRLNGNLEHLIHEQEKESRE